MCIQWILFWVYAGIIDALFPAYPHLFPARDADDAVWGVDAC